MSVLDNLLTGRHARIHTNFLAEMLFLPAVRREEVRHREAIEHIIELVELERYRHATSRVFRSGFRSWWVRPRARAGAHGPDAG